MKRNLVRSTLAAALNAEAAAPASPIFGLKVVIDDGTKVRDDEMEAELTGDPDHPEIVPPGAVIRLSPVLVTQLVSSASRRASEKAVVCAALRVMPDKLRAGFDYDGAVSATLAAGLRAGSNEVEPGDGQLVTKLMDDGALMTTGVFFLVAITTP